MISFYEMKTKEYIVCLPFTLPFINSRQKMNVIWQLSNDVNFIDEQYADATLSSFERFRFVTTDGVGHHLLQTGTSQNCSV